MTELEALAFKWIKEFRDTKGLEMGDGTATDMAIFLARRFEHALKEEMQVVAARLQALVRLKTDEN